MTNNLPKYRLITFPPVVWNLGQYLLTTYPPNLKEELRRGKETQKYPILQEYEVHSKIISAKKPHSKVPMDINRALVKECSVDLTPPIT